MRAPKSVIRKGYTATSSTMQITEPTRDASGRLVYSVVMTWNFCEDYKPGSLASFAVQMAKAVSDVKREWAEATQATQSAKRKGRKVKP